VKTGSEAANSASTSTQAFTDVKPATHSIATDGPTLHLEATGTNLAGISVVKLVTPGRYAD